MKIGYLGAGTWGFSLAFLLASKGFKVVSWSIHKELVDRLNSNEAHPFLQGQIKHPNMHFTVDLKEALQGAELVVESVTWPDCARSCSR